MERTLEKYGADNPCCGSEHCCRTYVLNGAFLTILGAMVNKLIQFAGSDLF